MVFLTLPNASIKLFKFKIEFLCFLCGETSTKALGYLTNCMHSSQISYLITKQNAFSIDYKNWQNWGLPHGRDNLIIKIVRLE
jgi:hypothetical protein